MLRASLFPFFSEVLCMKFPLAHFRWIASLSLLALMTPGETQAPYARSIRPRLKVSSRSIALFPPQTSSLPTRQIMVKFRPGHEIAPEQFAERVNRLFPRIGVVSVLTPNKGAVGKKSGFALAHKQVDSPKPLTFLRSIEQIGWHIFRVPSSNVVENIREAARLMPEVEDAILDQKLRLLGPPTNPKWGVPADQYCFANILNAILSDTFVPARNYDSGGWNYSWHLEMVDALPAWENYPGYYPTAAQRISLPVSRKPLVAVLDTGLDMSHPGFKGAGGTSTDAGAGGNIQTNLARSVYNGETSTDPTLADDVFGHGTSVAGVIAASPNNGMGIPGLGFPARIVPVRIYGANGDGQDSDLLRGIIYATDAGCVLINISARTDNGYSRAGQDAVDYAWSHNALVIAAMGNDGSATDAGAALIRRYPASYNRVLAVGATTYAGSDFTYNGHHYTGTLFGEALTSYTNLGQSLSVLAPGGDVTPFANEAPNQSDELWDALVTGSGYASGTVPEYPLIYTTSPTHTVPLSDPLDPAFGSYAAQGFYGLNYGSIPGTSFAAPLVTGLAALYCAKNNITQATPGGPLRILQAIERGADNVQGRADGGFDLTAGWGRINAAATLLEQNRRNATVGGVVGIVLNGTTIVPGNEVYIDSTSPGLSSATTTQDGVFHIFNITPGSHQLITSVNGTTITQNITVKAGCDVSGIELKKLPSAIQINPQNISVIYGRTQTFTATVTGLPSNQVFWSLPLNNGGRISATGVLTAPTSPGGSLYEIVKATSPDGNTSGTSIVMYAPLMQTFTVTPNTIAGGGLITGKITFREVPPDDVTVELRGSTGQFGTPPLNFPAQVTIPGGSNVPSTPHFVAFAITAPTTSQNITTTITATLAGIAKTVTISVTPGTAATVSGTVTLQGATHKNRSVTMIFRPVDGSPSLTINRTLRSDDSFTVPDLPTKSYRVWIKGDRWLAKVINVDATGGNVTNANATLLTGDINGDNAVDFGDLSQLLQVYNALEGDALYDERCDLNFDGGIDFGDLSSMLQNYNAFGDD